tara:strand:+ start:4504 stop:4899 length:396 start_codon:yes stop_codon:yes gene_type:complete
MDQIYKYVIILITTFIFSSCYTDPFFELTVKVVDESLSPVSNSEVKISITDIDNGQLIPGSILSDEGVTDSEGKISFSFENKAFITARACLENTLVGTVNYLCREGNVYLEEDTNKELTLMLQDSNCEFCN